MARLRKGVAYRRLERPYTRKSKYRNKSFVRSIPNNKIVKYDHGDLKKDFPITFILVSKGNAQLRHNCLESARLTINRTLEKNLGKKGFHFKINVYPHHVLRENPLASGAGADRMSTGMKKSFGKSIGLAAQIKEGQKVFTVSVDKGDEDTAKKALTKATSKMSVSANIVQIKKE
ncbi:50S ribosomal protein L16 [Candidatus Woesearchaeota archaeon]|nr:50S ribosomal protein L16 [Candidatus Woesearchaeota archaeon]